MRYRKLSSTGDYTFGAGQLNFYRDVPEAPAQAAKTRLQLFTGEWFLNVDEGTPYLISVLGKHSKTQADVTIQDRVLLTEGITNIENYNSEIDPDTRVMSVSMDVNTAYGPTQLQIDNYSNF